MQMQGNRAGQGCERLERLLTPGHNSELVDQICFPTVHPPNKAFDIFLNWMDNDRMNSGMIA